MGFDKFFKDMKKTATDFLDKKETKEAISKLKVEFGEVKNKVSKLVEEGDTILKKKVDELMKKKKEGHTVDGESEEVNADSPVTETKEDVKTDVSDTATQEDVKIDVPDTATQEDVKVDVPVTETQEDVKIDVPDTETQDDSLDSLGLADKLKNSLIDGGITTVSQLKETSDADILSIKGVGAAALRKLKTLF